MKGPSPAFSFYPKDWLTDGNVKVMTYEEKGVYIDLLSIYWLEGDLPSDTARLARLVNLPVRRFEKLWTVLAACFSVEGDRLKQKRSEKEKLKQAAYRQSQSEKGARSANSRKLNTGNKPGLSLGSIAVQPKVNLPSPSPSPLTTTQQSASSASVEPPPAADAALESSRADLRKVIADAIAVGIGATPEEVLAHPRIIPPNGNPVRLETCTNARLMAVAADKIRGVLTATKAPRPARKTGVPSWDLPPDHVPTPEEIAAADRALKARLAAEASPPAKKAPCPLCGASLSDPLRCADPEGLGCDWAQTESLVSLADAAMPRRRIA